LRAKEEEKPKSPAETALALVRNQFLDADNSTIDERDEAETARSYFDGTGHWTDEERKALEARGQPCITDNKVKDKVEYLLGMERKTRTDPKAYPRNVEDEGGADAATDALRYVADDNMFNYVRSDAAENMFIEGRGAIQVIIDKKYGGKIPKVCVQHVRWDRCYVDPHSMKADYSDASYKGIITWMDYDDAVDRWPGMVAAIDESFTIATSQSETTDDKPQFVVKTTGRKRIQVFEHYFLKKGRWHYCEFVSGGFLKEPVLSAYEDENGEPCCPIEMQALYREGDTGRAYGAIRRFKDLQDDWNKRRSKSLHLLNSNQVLMEDGAAGSDSPDGLTAIDKVRREAARPDGVLTFIPGMKMEIKNNLDLSAGHVQLMMLTGQSLDATGPNAALSGQTGDISGRAKQIDQQGGLVQIDKPFDAIKFLTLRVYRHIWNRITQFWTAETWIRVRGEEQIKFIALNRKVTRGELIAAELKTADMPDEEKAELLKEIDAKPEEYGKEIILNNVSELDVDITIDDGPDVLTLQQETFTTLGELAKTGMVQIPPKALIEAAPLRSSVKRKMLDAMSGANDPMQQQMAAMQAQMAELAKANAEFKNMLLEAQIRKTVAETNKTEAAAKETAVDSAVKVAEFISPEMPAAPKTQVSVN
jgi:hypothetical protein